MSVLPSFKDIREMISQYKNTELNQMILDLQAQVLNMAEENRELREEGEALKKRLEIEGKMTFRTPFWYMEGDEQPYCPNCKESKSTLVHLVGDTKKNLLYSYPKCLTNYDFWRDSREWRVQRQRR